MKNRNKLNIRHTPKTILITGGAGFIGSNLVRHLLETDDKIKVINYDALTYAGSLLNLQGIEEEYKKRYIFIKGDICNEQQVASVFKDHQPNTIIHLAAESHVDRSIDGPAEFLKTNIMGTYTLLACALSSWKDRTDVRFHHVSTDEVYGSLGKTGLFTEETPYDPSSPYSASKASSDHLVRAWNRTFNLPVTITNCSNNYGPYQFPEKLIPLMIANGVKEKPLPVYGNGLNIRDWLHVKDHCQAIDKVVRYADDGSTYNVGGINEWTNIDLVHLLCKTLDEVKPLSENNKYNSLISFVKDRPGHDARYAICADKLVNDLNWKPEYTFEEGLKETVNWYLDNEKWIKDITDEKYDGERLGSS